MQCLITSLGISSFFCSRSSYQNLLINREKAAKAPTLLSLPSWITTPDNYNLLPLRFELPFDQRGGIAQCGRCNGVVLSPVNLIVVSAVYSQLSK
jgi:hypothetical protein